MLQFLYDLINWQYFGLFLIMWTSIDIFWISKWQALFRRVGGLIQKPLIFETDEDSSSHPLYPRRFLEGMVKKRNDENAGVFNEFIAEQEKVLFNKEHPFRTVVYILLLACLIMFAIADSIAVLQTLALLGLFQLSTLPALFQEFSWSIFGGSILAGAVGVWFFIEIQGDNNDMIGHGMNQQQKNVVKALAVFMSIFAVVIMLAFAFQRLIAMGILTSSPTSQIIIQVILYGLTAVNNFIGVAICFREGIKGLVTSLFLLAKLIKPLLPVLVFIIDILWRFVHILFDIVIWALVTPFLVIPAGISKIITSLNPKPVMASNEKHDFSATQKKK